MNGESAWNSRYKPEDYSVDIEDLMYHNDDDDILKSLQDGEKFKKVFPTIFKNSIESDPMLNGYRGRSIWDKASDWLSENPGLGFSGAILLGTGIAYLYNKYKSSDNPIGVRRKKRRKFQTESLASIKKENEVLEKEVLEVKDQTKIIAAVSGVVAGTTVGTAGLSASILSVTYGLLRYNAGLLYGGIGFIVGSVIKEFFLIKKATKPLQLKYDFNTRVSHDD